jgi:hypothetical protein
MMHGLANCKPNEASFAIFVFDLTMETQPPPIGFFCDMKDCTMEK